MKKAIICFPKINNIIWNQTQFPIGIYKIKQYCKGKYDVIILDERLEEDIFTCIDELLDEDILCLGLSVMTGEQIRSAIKLSKRYHGKTAIVWGGVHPTILPVNTMKADFIDYIIRGDGEEAFLNLLTYLDNGKVEQELFMSKENENLNINYLNDLNKSNIDFATEKIYTEYFLKRDGMKKVFTIETSRGCPHRCAFCHNTILGHNYRTVDTNYVISAIKCLKNQYSIDGIAFQEDNFFLNINRVKELVEYMSNLKDFGWKANSRISYFSKLLKDKELMNKIVESNCKVLQFGIESGSDRILKLINKGITVNEILDINRKLSKYNLTLRYNFIIGFPTETVNEIDNTIHLIDRLMCENPHLEPPFVNIYTPYPGTPIFDLAVKMGFVPPQTLEEWADISWNKTNNMIHDKKIETKIYDLSNSFLKNNQYLR